MRSTNTTKRIAVFSLSALVAASLAAQSPTAPRKGGNPEAAKIMNPAPMSPESVAAGKRVYTRLCQNCHGATGKGDGPGAAASATQPADLTDAMWEYGSTDGEIFTVVHDGTSMDMGSYAGRISDTDIWNVVNYVRTLSADRK